MNSGYVTGYDTETQFMEKLASDSNITEKTFSLYLSEDAGASYIDFGAPNTSVYSDPVVTIDIEDENENWASKITGFRWGASMNDSTEYAMTEAVARIDTESGCFSVPSSDV